MLLPLTLAVIDGMLIACGAERYIIPTLSVVESIRPDSSMIFTITGKGEIVNLRGETIPLFRLDRLLNIPDAEQVPTQALVVVVESHGRKIGLLVDDVLTQQQVVIKGLGEGLPGTRYLSGAAILSDGRVGLILNTHEIANLVDASTFRPRQPACDAPAIAATPIPRGGDTHTEIRV
jgi:two-component system chemotaxis sensor kinase CheA